MAHTALSASTALVPVFTGTLAGIETLLCNARDLHAFLQVGKKFPDWIKLRIEQYGFVDGEDFTVCFPDLGSKTRGGHNRTDYHLTLDMAKELSMVENNDQGRMARRYFIAMEKRAQGLPVPVFAPPKPPIRKAADLSFFGTHAKHGESCWWNLPAAVRALPWAKAREVGGAYFAELVELAAHDEDEAFTALFAVLGCAWDPSHNNDTSQWQRAGAVEYGFACELARAALTGLRAMRKGSEEPFDDIATRLSRSPRTGRAKALAAPREV